MKLDSRYDNYTVADIKGFCRKLSKTLHLSSGGVLRLCRIEKGCIQLIFQVPSFVQQKIFPLSREQEKALEAEGVIKLTCGKYQFPALTEEPRPSATSQTELIQSVEEQNIRLSVSMCILNFQEARSLQLSSISSKLGERLDSKLCSK